jgi:chromosome segregation ATPase
MTRTLLAAGLVLAIGAAVGAQSQHVSSLDDVVNEIRALRGDLNQSSSVALRTQLLVARLSLQEQRIVAVSRQLTEAQAQLDGIARANAMTQTHLKQQEEQMPRVSAEARAHFEAEIKQMKPVFEQQQKHEQALRAQVNELASMLAAEQNRWSDFNDRIDALERSLPGK